MSQEVDVLITIRKIIRATDLYSRQLSKKSGLTAPQLLVLQAIQEMGAVAISRLSTHVSLSQATVTSILDRLEGRALVSRHRSTMDKRVVHATLTTQGEAMIQQAPKPLQDVFSAAFEKTGGMGKVHDRRLVAACCLHDECRAHRCIAHVACGDCRRTRYQCLRPRYSGRTRTRVSPIGLRRAPG